MVTLLRMKKTARLFSIIAFITVILYTMAACDDGTEPGGGNPGTTVPTVPTVPNLPGTITITPNTDIYIGMTLIAEYSGIENVSYQWNRNGNPINSTTTTTYTTTEAGQYTVTVSAANYKSKTSAAVTVINGLNLAGNISITPSGTVITGTTLTGIYTGTEDVIITCQWNKNGIPINNETNATYIPTQEGSYTITVGAAGYNSKTSAPVIVVLPDLSGTINITPNTVVAPGMTLTAVYSGAEPVSYQWNRNETAISGATSGTYTPLQTGSYTVTVSAVGYNSLTSAPVTVAIPDLSGTITITPDTGVTPGTTLTAVYNGAENVSYQWDRNGTSISGAVGGTYTPAQVGNYTVTVSAANYNDKTSDPVAVLLNLSGDITITPNTGVYVGTTLTASYSGGSEIVSYQWNRNGNVINGATSATHTPTHAGSYTVTISAVNCYNKTSDAITVDSGTINVTFTGPSQKVISINRNITNNLSKNADGAITLTINESFDRYEWLVGTRNLASGNSVTLQASDSAFVIGNNWITIVVYTGTGANAIPWSGEFFVYISE